MAKLYIVEGLPCSGKSTTAKHMADRLTAGGRNVKFVDEGSEDHPADFENCAYVTGGQLAAFPPGLRERVRTGGKPRMDGYVVPMGPFGGAAGERLRPYKIYDALPWETEMPLMLDNWARFAEQAEDTKTGTVYVFNCVLLQNPMCETMMRFGFPQEQSLAYISQIVERIGALDPAVVYLKNDEIAPSVRAAAEERPGWLDAVVEYHVNGGYGKSVGAQGFDGYIACLEERQRRELAILEQLPVKSLVLDNPQRDWKGAYAQINRFMAREGDRV